MALEDYLESEVGIAIAATALVLSPPVRNTVRRGLVYTLASAIRVGDALSGVARGMAQEAQNVKVNAAAAAQDGMKEARTTARTGRAAPAAQPKAEA